MSDFQDEKISDLDGLELDYPSFDISSTEGIEKDDNIPKSVVFATAHHADDQHETMLLKLIRGAYITNLQPVCKCVVMYVPESLGLLFLLLLPQLLLLLLLSSYLLF